MTLLEVLVVVCCLCVIAALVLPSLSGGGPSKTSKCLSNVKQTSLAFALWRDDHNGKFPMEVVIAEAGSKEFRETRSVFQHFKVLGPYLVQSPRSLICPLDKARIVATNFQALANSNISYFVGIDLRAADLDINQFLAGDRNLTNGTEAPAHTTYTLATNQPLGWSAKLHTNWGVIAFGDLHVSVPKTAELQAQIAALCSQTNRIAIP